jgi:predicted porin
MKKTVIAALFAALTGAAQAQSSVTIFGLINNGVQYEAGLPHGSLFSAQTGDYLESRLGFEGKEDLGDGTRATFRLEMGLDTLNGSYLNGGLFGREATVGLSSDKFGTFKVGNLGSYEIQSNTYFLDPQSMLFYCIATLVRGRNFAQTGNGFEYTTASFGGFTLKGQYDLSNEKPWNGNGGVGSGPGQLGGAQGRSDGILAQYDGSYFQLMGIYDEIRDPYGQFSNVYVSSRSATAGGNVTLGPVKIFTGYQHLSAPDASDYGYFGTGTPTTLPAGTSLPTVVNHEWLGAAWQVNAFNSLTAAVYHANANNGNGNATLYTLAGIHNLSKRTLVFAELAYVHNSATSNLGLGDGYSNPYGANSNNDPVNGGSNTNPDYGHGQFGAFTGINTSF